VIRGGGWNSGANTADPPLVMQLRLV